MILKKPKISIIVNCYNGQKFLKDALKSIINQTYKNFEVIFWDNKSTDNSKKIFLSFKDKRFKYFISKNFTTLYQARNSAIKKAKSEFITFLDTDDLWEKNKLQLQLKYFEEKKVGLVYTNFLLLKNSNKKVKLFNKMNKKNTKINFFKDRDIGILTVMIRKKYLNKLKYIFEKKFTHIGDFDLFWRLFKICKFKYIDLPLATYRIHENNLSTINRENEINELKYWLNKNRKKFLLKEKKIINRIILNKYILLYKFDNNYKKIIGILLDNISLIFNIKNIMILISPKFLLRKLIWF